MTQGVAYLSDNNIWASGWGGGGGYGRIYSFDGTRWILSTGVDSTSSTISAIDFTASNDGWAIREGGAILHFNGATWTTDYSGGYSSWADIVSLSNNNVWATANNGLVHWNGVSWVTVNLPHTFITEIRFSSPNAGYAVTGNSGCYMYYYNGVGWAALGQVTSTSHANFSKAGISGVSQSDIWVAAGGAFHYDGSSWVEYRDPNTNQPLTNHLITVLMITSTDGWAAGYDGSIYHYNGSSWRQVASPTTQAINRIKKISATELIAVGDGGVFRYR